MLTRPFLFRLLLSFSLLLNGSAFASPMIVGMDMSAGSTGSSHHGAPALIVAHAIKGCHEVANVAGVPVHAVGGASRQAPAPAVPDCCRNGGCHCACMQAMPLVSTTVEFRGMTLVSIYAVSVLHTGHIPPTASPLIRPPIV